jgi:hypothetical protein
MVFATLRIVSSPQPIFSEHGMEGSVKLTTKNTVAKCLSFAQENIVSARELKKQMGKRVDLVLEFCRSKYGSNPFDREAIFKILLEKYAVREELDAELEAFEQERAEKK